MNPIYAQVDQYYSEILSITDPILDEALALSKEAELPEIAVSPALGKFLQVLALSTRAKSILEIGTLAGFSTINLARALPPDGKMITLEFEPKHVEIAKQNLDTANLSDKVEVLQGEAYDHLQSLVDSNHPPFDLIFVDADKHNYYRYFPLCLKLSHPGTLIILDNVVRQGDVINPDTQDPNSLGIRKLNELVSRTPNLTTTVIQTVGSKGHDGMMLIVIN